MLQTIKHSKVLQITYLLPIFLLNRIRIISLLNPIKELQYSRRYLNSLLNLKILHIYLKDKMIIINSTNHSNNNKILMLLVKNLIFQLLINQQKILMLCRRYVLSIFKSKMQNKVYNLFLSN